MNEFKESEKLAETLSTKATFEITAKSVLSFDALMIEIKKKQEQFVTFSLDVTCKWETMHTHIDSAKGIDQRMIKAQGLHSDYWDEFMNRIRDAETEVITYLNQGRVDGMDKIVPIFSCNAKLHIEFKDKEAQKSLEDDKQLIMFKPIDRDERKYREEMKMSDFGDIRSDGNNIESVKFQQIKDGVAIGDEVEIIAK